jgi:hemerythrin-like domain-containing protein
LLAELETQHRHKYELIDALSEALDHEADVGAPVGALAEATWRHLNLEESRLLPLACETLTDEDWREAAEAFEGNRDPDLGALDAEAFRAYFARLAKLLPSAH